MIKIIPKEEFDVIKNSDLPKFEKLTLLADMCRLNTLVSIKKAGSGHLGSSLSAMDIIIYLYYEKMNTMEVGYNSQDRDIYFSSKGHDVPGLYSLLYSLGIISLEKLLKLRRLNGLDGHPEINIPGIEASSGSLGMGISKGKGMAWAKNYNNHKGHVYVLVGDGELQEGQIFESLQTTAQQNISNLTVIVDHNKYQTDKKVDDIVSLRNLEEKVKTFGWHVNRIDGHDYQQIDEAFSAFDTVIDIPKFLILDNIKGKGISFMEPENVLELYKWHSGAPDDKSFEKGFNELREKIENVFSKYDIEDLKFVNIKEEKKSNSSISNEYIAQAFGDELVKIAEDRDDIIVLDGDLSADCKIRDYEHKFPNRFIENGIAEQDMVSMAGGLASQGLIPVVNSFASFLAARPNEQIYNNSTENNKIIYACHFAGMVPAGPGKSHQSVRDISLFSAFSNVCIIQPCNTIETKNALRYFIDSDDVVCVLRMNIGPSPQIIRLPDNYQFKKGVGTVIANGEDACVLSYGPVMLNEALIAREILSNYNIDIRVINMPWLNNVDKSFFNDCLIKDKPNIVIEDHMIKGGLFDSINRTMVLEEKSLSISSIGLNELPKCGNPTEVLEYHGLSGIAIARKIAHYLNVEAKIINKIIDSDYSFSPQ